MFGNNIACVQKFTCVRAGSVNFRFNRDLITRYIQITYRQV
jgi:hypothetical protein